MIVWLDHRIFGNGRGLKSPHFDDVFYWLSGDIYTWVGGLGAQLSSIQWRQPELREERILCGRKFVPFTSYRRWGRVMVSWACTELSPDLSIAAEQIKHLKRDLNAARGGQ